MLCMLSFNVLILVLFRQVFKKLSLGSYRWISYNEAQTISVNLGKGLRALGQSPLTPIAIYAETRAEWIMSAFGAFSQSICLATLYTNLGDEAIVHGINDTEVSETDPLVAAGCQMILSHIPPM